jgi:hypothetical protein
LPRGVRRARGGRTSDFAAPAALAVANQDSAARWVEIGLGEIERLTDPQAGSPQDHAALVPDSEQRREHLMRIPIADTAMMLEWLPRGAVLPPGSRAGSCGRSQLGISLRLTRAGRESYAVKTMALCLDLRLLLLPRKGE